MHKSCPVCGVVRKYGDSHQYTHNKYQKLFRSAFNRTPNARDLTILELSDKGVSYTNIGIMLGISKQRVGQRMARMGIYRDKTKIPKKYRKVEA